MCAMARALLLACLLACSYAQLIYPDEYARVINVTERPQIYALPPDRRSRLQFAALQDRVPPAASVAAEATQQLNPQYDFASAAAQTGSPNQQTYTTQQSTVTENSLQQWDDYVNNIITRGIEKFTLDIEREIYKTNPTGMSRQHENVVFSPLSLSVALAMVLLGSAGRTFDEISKVFGLETGIDVSRHSEVVHQMFGLLLSRTRNRFMDSRGPQINSASAVFVQDGYSIRPEFATIVENAYQSEVINLDFVGKPKQSQDTINSWVNRKTMGKIPTILNDMPDYETRVIIASALYFKGEWNQYFLADATKRKPFYIEGNEAITVDMMYNGGVFPFYEDKQLGVKVVSLPYKGLETAMYVLLPTAKGATALRNFQNQLTPNILEFLIDNVKNETCIIGLPRMKLSSSLSLSSALSHLGISTLFERTADLSLLSSGYNAQTARPAVTAFAQKPSVPTVAPLQTANVPPFRGRQQPAGLTDNNDILIFSRIGGGINPVRRNFFSYEDKVRGYFIEQWNTGFSIRNGNRFRRDVEKANKESREGFKGVGSEQKEGQKDSYVVNESEPSADATKVVNLEQNKYRFQNADAKGTVRRKRQGRPINEDFLQYVKAKNFPAYGLDDLRNSANLVNPHLYANTVLHKVQIDITEKGTEASAATAVLLERDGNQKRLIADRPFIFFIRHNPSKLLLFWGTINAPTPNYSVT